MAVPDPRAHVSLKSASAQASGPVKNIVASKTQSRCIPQGQIIALCRDHVTSSTETRHPSPLGVVRLKLKFPHYIPQGAERTLLREHSSSVGAPSSTRMSRSSLASTTKASATISSASLLDNSAAYSFSSRLSGIVSEKEIALSRPRSCKTVVLYSSTRATTSLDEFAVTIGTWRFHHRSFLTIS